MSDENTKIKKRGRGGKYNFPNAIDPDTIDKEAMSYHLRNTIHWLKEGLDHRAQTDEDIYTKTMEYFEYCANNKELPLVESYCLMLGYATNTVNEWKNGKHCSSNRSTIIKSAYQTIATYDAAMVTTNKQPAIPYIFRAKNYYGMTDKQEITVQPGQTLQPEDVQTIADKYQELPED